MLSRIIALALLLTAGTAALASPTAAQTCANQESDRMVTELGVRKSVSVVARSDAPQPRQIGDAQGNYRYVRVLIEPPGAAGGWTLYLRDSAYRTLQTLGPEDFAGSAPLWTQRLPASAVFLDLEAGGSQQPLAATAIAYVGMPTNPPKGNTYYSLKTPGAPDFRAIEQLSPKRRIPLGDSVGLLVTAWDSVSWTCTGVAVTPTLFLTNWHCGRVFRRDPAGELDQPDFYWRRNLCDDATIDFSWDGDQVSHDFTCARVLAADQAHDYALLKINPAGASSALRPARIVRTRLGDGEALTVIHHPAARPKQASEACTVKAAALPSWRGDLADVRFTHDCDTEGGSSGAPVFDSAGALRGLHHHGFDVDAATCAQTDRLNKAIHIDAILAHLAANAGLQDTPEVRTLLAAAGVAAE